MSTADDSDAAPVAAAVPVAAVPVAVVVVTHRGVGGPIAECLASLADTTAPTTRIMVVDNGLDGRPGADARYGPGCHEVLSTSNRGYGAALNAGFAAVRSEWGTDDAMAGDAVLVALNDDVVVHDGWLEPLVAALGADDALGAVQPVLLDAGTGRINSVGVELAPDGSGFDIGQGASEIPQESRSIEIFTGGAVAFRARFLDDVGGFDERYFLYYEDVDLALRGAERGWRYRCESSSVVSHHGGVSTSRLGHDLARLHERNRLWTSLRFGSATMILRSVWLGVRRLRVEPRRAHLRGLLAGVGAAPRVLRARRRGAGAL